MKHIKSYENNKEDEYVIIKVNSFYSILKIIRRYLSNTGVDYIEVKQLYVTKGDEIIEQKINRKLNFTIDYMKDIILYTTSDLDDCLESLETIIQQDKYNL